jgi:hypothetical protein
LKINERLAFYYRIQKFEGEHTVDDGEDIAQEQHQLIPQNSGATPLSIWNKWSFPNTTGIRVGLRDWGSSTAVSYGRAQA